MTDASKSQALSYKRLKQSEAKLRAEVAQLFALAEQADRSAVPEGMDLPQMRERIPEREKNP